MPSETVAGFMQALSGLNRPEIILMVQEALKKNWQFLPTPGELLEIVQRLREEEPYEAPAACALCHGTKFRMVRVDGPMKGYPYQAAVPCDCASDIARSQQAAWLKKFNPAVVSREQ